MAKKTTAKKSAKPAAKKSTGKSAKYVYTWGAGKADGNGSMKALLGGKGANLAELTRIGPPVPPGFTIPTEGDPLAFTVPRGASLHEVTDTLVARGVIERAPLFRAYVRIKRKDRALKAGVFALRQGESWNVIVDALAQPTFIQRGAALILVLLVILIPAILYYLWSTNRAASEIGA